MDTVESMEALLAKQIKAQLSPEERTAMLALEEQTFGIAFETFLDQIAGGTTLDRAIKEYHTPIAPSKFRAWVYRDQRRKNAYMVAKAIGAEAVEDELIRIADGLNADGTPSMNDTPRATLQINTRFRLLQVWNRKRYGDVKQVNTTSTATVDVASIPRDELRRQILEGLGIGVDQQSQIFENGDPFEEAA